MEWGNFEIRFLCVYIPTLRSQCHFGALKQKNTSFYYIIMYILLYSLFYYKVSFIICAFCNYSVCLCSTVETCPIRWRRLGQMSHIWASWVSSIALICVVRCNPILSTGWDRSENIFLYIILNLVFQSIHFY